MTLFSTPVNRKDMYERPEPKTVQDVINILQDIAFQYGNKTPVSGEYRAQVEITVTFSSDYLDGKEAQIPTVVIA